MDGENVAKSLPRVVIVVNKPIGYLSTCRKGREQGVAVTELVDAGVRLFPAGRLDRDSEGLLVLTNDGDLALRLTHPRYGKEKEYEVALDRPCREQDAARLVKGIELEDGPARAVRAEGLDRNRLRVVLTEGRRRQVRRMLSALGYEVRRLQRVRVAGLELGRLGPGAWRKLSEREVEEKLLAPPRA